MAYQITTGDICVGEIKDQAGGLAEKLEAVSKAGANLDFLIARRSADKSGTGVVFLAPAHGEDATRAAEQAGLSKWASAHSLRIEGPDRPGLGATIARTVAGAGINMRGMSGAKIGDRVVFYLALDSSSDVDNARGALTKSLSG